MGLFTKKEIKKQIVNKRMSYKLDINIEPWWGKLYQKSIGESSEEKIVKELKKKEAISENIDSNLYGRRYYFTEYYDSSTGLTMRFQRVVFPSGKQLSYAVDEFGDMGYFFYNDGKLSLNDGVDLDKLSIHIGEDFIRNNLYDRNIGDRKKDFQFSKVDYLFQFPLRDIFNFLFALGRKFHDTENNAILKWPDQIQSKFDELGITYETYFDYEPDSLGIDEHYKEFFEKWGKPVVSLSGDSDDTRLSTDEISSYQVKLKIFKPIDNERFIINND